jgi:hypothetical protein
MPCLSYLKFPSFTDNACNSLTLDAVANAIKNTVFHVKNFTSQDKRGSKGGSHNLQSTEGKSSWIVSLIKWVYQDTSKHLSTVHAHDTRKLATSWALFKASVAKL